MCYITSLKLHKNLGYAIHYGVSCDNAVMDHLWFILYTVYICMDCRNLSLTWWCKGVLGRCEAFPFCGWLPSPLLVV